MLFIKKSSIYGLQRCSYSYWTWTKPAGTMLRLWDVYSDGLVQERRNSSAIAMELRLSCTNPSIWVSDADHHWFRYWLVTCSMPSYHLKWWWLIVLFGPSGINFSEICSRITKFSVKKMYLKMSSAKKWPQWVKEDPCADIKWNEPNNYKCHIKTLIDESCL